MELLKELLIEAFSRRAKDRFKPKRKFKSGKFKSPLVGKKVKIIGGKDKGKTGIVKSVSREPTFSQTVPFIIELSIELENGKKVLVKKDLTRKA